MSEIVQKCDLSVLTMFWKMDMAEDNIYCILCEELKDYTFYPYRGKLKEITEYYENRENFVNSLIYIVDNISNRITKVPCYIFEQKNIPPFIRKKVVVKIKEVFYFLTECFARKQILEFKNQIITENDYNCNINDFVSCFFNEITLSGKEYVLYNNDEKCFLMTEVMNLIEKENNMLMENKKKM